MKPRQTIANDGTELWRGFRIRTRELETCTRYVVDYSSTDGKRKREQFPTLAEARGHCEQLALDRERQGAAAILLTDDQRKDAADALAILEGTGRTLVDAAKALATSIGHGAGSDITVSRAVREFLDWMNTTPVKLSARYPGPYRSETIHGTRHNLTAFAAALGDRPLSAVQSQEIKAYLDAMAIAASSWDVASRHISMLYVWAAKPDGIAPGLPNPVKDITKPAAPKTLPAIYTPESVAAIMACAERLGHARSIPDLATGFFAGLRPTERRRVPWRDVDMSTGEILVRAANAKTHADRLVTMPANLRAWLAAYPLPGSSALAFRHGTTDARRAIMRETGLEWIQDGERHSYATYCAAMHGMDYAAEQLGHTTTAILHKHYRGLVRNRRIAAEEYFGILPKCLRFVS